MKVLSLFMMKPDEEYYIRELTRKLDEQINSVRRELTNLKKLGLLRSRFRNRKKFYVVNKSFVLFPELRNIVMKCLNSKDNLVKKIRKFGDIHFLLMAGLFIEKNREDAVDLLIVGEVDKAALQNFLNEELETERPVKFTVMSREDFVYRVKCKDRFVTNLLKDNENIIGINDLEDEIADVMI